MRDLQAIKDDNNQRCREMSAARTAKAERAIEEMHQQALDYCAEKRREQARKQAGY